jgi:hypothetical protein
MSPGMVLRFEDSKFEACDCLAQSASSSLSANSVHNKWNCSGECNWLCPIEREGYLALGNAFLVGCCSTPEYSTYRIEKFVGRASWLLHSGACDYKNF